MALLEGFYCIRRRVFSGHFKANNVGVHFSIRSQFVTEIKNNRASNTNGWFLYKKRVSIIETRHCNWSLIVCQAIGLIVIKSTLICFGL